MTKSTALTVIEKYRNGDIQLLDATEQTFDAADPGQFEAIEAVPQFAANWARLSLVQNDARNILTATVNASGACPIGATSLCGQYCFAHKSWSASTSPREDAPEKYLRDAQRLRDMGKNVGIFMSYDTEPFPGGKICAISRRILRAMIEKPPAALLIHSHTAHIGNPEVVDLLADLSQATNVIAGIGFETDSDDTGANRPHHHSVQDRVAAIVRLAKKGVKTQASTTPLLGYLDYRTFVRNFRDNGIYRVMTGELRKEFTGGGTAKAIGMDIGLPTPTEEEATAYCNELQFPGGVDVREKVYVTMN